MSILVALLGLFGLIGTFVWASVRSSKRDIIHDLQKQSAEASDDIRRKAQQARTEHDKTTPRLTDDELDAELVRLRRAVEAARKTR